MSRNERHEIRDSEYWQSTLQTIYAPLWANRAISESSKDAVCMMLGSSYFPVLYASVYGEPPPSGLAEKISQKMKELINNESEATREAVGDDFVSLGDYAHVMDPRNALISSDGTILARLDKLLPEATEGSGGPELSALGARLRDQFNITAPGLLALKNFHKVIFEANEASRVLSHEEHLAPWQWSDTAMVALVLFTTGHWDLRLWNIYGPRITDTMRTALAKYWLETLDVPAGAPHLVTRDEPLLAAFLLQLVNWPLAG